MAVPVAWEELDGIDRANAFDIFSAADRAQGSDVWKGYFEAEQTLTERIQEVIKKH